MSYVQGSAKRWFPGWQKPRKSGKQEKRQISPNLGTAFLPSPVNSVSGTSEKTVRVPAVEGELAVVTYDIIFSCTFAICSSQCQFNQWMSFLRSWILPATPSMNSFEHLFSPSHHSP